MNHTLDKAKKLLIIGCPGSGKTTLSKKLSSLLKLPLIHMDQLFWDKGWVEKDPEEFKKDLQYALNGDQWIIDGNYTATVSMRLKHADTVILLEFNRWICAWRVLKRWIKQDGYQAQGCPQKVDFTFLKYILWDHYRINHSLIMQYKNSNQNIVWLTLKNSKDVKELISSII